MIKKILFLFVLSAFWFFILKPAMAAKPHKSLPPVGEKIIYDLKLGQLYMGKVEFVYVGEVDFEGRKLNLMNFQAQTLNFLDKEEIYSQEDLLPVKIAREVTTLFKKEEIQEDYDQKRFILTISKKNGQGEEKTVIKKKNTIHNAILFPHYLRRIGPLKIGSIFHINLPNRQIKLKLVTVKKINLPCGTFQAYYFEGLNNEVKIWLSADERRIPLKIEGSGPLGYTLVLKEYIL